MIRTKSSIMDASIGIIGLILNTIFSFISRSIFIRVLGGTYLGLNGLFSNILSMLSLAELGIGNVIIFNLYKPIAENNKEKIKSLMRLYERTYKIIGITIFIAGLMIIPFLNFIIKSNEIIPYVHLIYFLYLINTVLSYLFFSYKKSIIFANQKAYMVNAIAQISNIAMYIVQTIILILFKNFIIYLIVQIFFNLIQNIIVSIMADKMYGYIKEKEYSTISKEEKKSMFENVKALFINKISNTIISGTDNLIISKFIGIWWVGVYSNYFLIVNTVHRFLVTIFNSMIASLGNLNATKDHKKKKQILNIMLFLSQWLYGACGICICILCNDFIKLWLGKDLVLSYPSLYGIALVFYITGIQTPIIIYRDTMGLFTQGKFLPLVASIINIIASIWLGKLFGISGVFIGTILSKLSISIWFDPLIVYRNGFGTSVKKYFNNYIKYFSIVLVSGIILSLTIGMLKANTIILFINKAILSFLSINIIFYFFFRRREEFIYLKNIAINLIRKIIKK